MDQERLGRVSQGERDRPGEALLPLQCWLCGSNLRLKDRREENVSSFTTDALTVGNGRRPSKGGKNKLGMQQKMGKLMPDLPELEKTVGVSMTCGERKQD